MVSSDSHQSPSAAPKDSISKRRRKPWKSGVWLLLIAMAIVSAMEPVIRSLNNHLTVLTNSLSAI